MHGSRTSIAKNVNCMIMGIVPSGKDDFGIPIIAAEAQGRLRCVGKAGSAFTLAAKETNFPM
jgi:hypothetical protein